MKTAQIGEVLNALSKTGRSIEYYYDRNNGGHLLVYGKCVSGQSSRSLDDCVHDLFRELERTTIARSGYAKEVAEEALIELGLRDRRATYTALDAALDKADREYDMYIDQALGKAS